MKNNLTKKKQTKNQFNPAYAIDLINKLKQGQWFDAFKVLPRNIRYALISGKTEKLIEKICQKYQLKSAERIGSVSVLVRDYIAGSLREEQLKKEIFQRFQFNTVLAGVFLEDFNKIIGRIKKIGIEAVKGDLVVLSFRELMERFPETEKYEIGTSFILILGENTKTKPSIRNWITDYKLRKKSDQESAILNVGNYIYSHPNTNDLNSEDREKLAVILKAFENNQKIYYNKLFKEIDFEIIKLLEKKQNKKSKLNITKLESKPYYEVDK